MRFRSLRYVLFLFATLATSPAPALDEAETRALRGVIETQLDAFRRGDAAGAYAQAAPTIRRLFPDEATFMEMVRRGYGALIAPKSFSFGKLADAEHGQQAQIVDLVDSAGNPWRALYTLEKQPDGTWKITGCYLVVAPGEAV